MGKGVCPGEGCLPRGCLPKECWDTPPSKWTEFLTHACENITFPQLLLRAVIINFAGNIPHKMIQSVTVLIAFLLTIQNVTLNKELLICHESI